MTIEYSDQVDIAALMAEITRPLDGMRLERGRFVLPLGSSDTTFSVDFATPFQTAPLVFCTPILLGMAGYVVDIRWGNTTGASDGVGATTGFVFQARRSASIPSGASTTIRVNWFALGA